MLLLVIPDVDRLDATGPFILFFVYDEDEHEDEDDDEDDDDRVLSKFLLIVSNNDLYFCLGQ